MMEESADEAIKREEMLRQYHACKEAMKIIGDVSMATLGGSAPQSVNWMSSSSTSSGMSSSMGGSGSGMGSGSGLGSGMGSGSTTT